MYRLTSHCTQVKALIANAFISTSSSDSTRESDPSCRSLSRILVAYGTDCSPRRVAEPPYPVTLMSILSVQQMLAPISWSPTITRHVKGS